MSFTTNRVRKQQKTGAVALRVSKTRALILKNSWNIVYDAKIESFTMLTTNTQDDILQMT